MRNLVEFCPAEPFASLSIARGYRDPGACRDGAAPLLKPVVASAGDAVELSARGISVNGVLLPNTAPLSKDTKGPASRSVALRALLSWPPEPSGWPPPIIRAASTAATSARYRLRPFAID